ncbi:uncharacterized protein EI90DRAFT_1308848 [Cantharellus anzutake]|uniref:uncharacterized protein n=1 Tax=Cantharellus anzutake TaxID=1750568 RepID=UPI001905B9B8|nr:uncharacterized protein EI90DRAFT_1308848 [Cantharellus anzutake]KAF8342170.1 hypothetical protein EI90DRAFT_1308848 [Cantharellus anzutake]
MAIFHLIHEHPPNSFKYLGCVRDIAQNLQQTAVRLIYSHPKFKQCTSSVITGLEIYECLEPMPTGVGPTRRMLEDVAKNPLDSDKVKLILEQATQCEDLMVVFSKLLRSPEFGSSFGRYEWTAHPWDSPKGLYDYVSSVVTPRLGSEEILRALSLYQVCSVQTLMHFP